MPISSLRRAARTATARLSRLWRFSSPSGGQVRLALRQPLLLPAFGLLLAWYIARPSPVAVVAVVTTGGLLAAGYLWVRRLALGLSAGRRLQYAAVQVGDEIEELVRLTNRSLLPALWAEFVDHSNIPGYSLSSVRAVDGGSSFEWRAHAICTLRGNYHFGPWELLSGDPFGLFRVSIAYDQQEEILVYPPLAALPEPVIPRGRVQGDDRTLRQALPAESMAAFSTRPYLPGDPLRRVHWPSSARHDNLLVKVFDPEASSTLWLIPDLDQAAQRGQGAGSTLETTITLLASLANRLLADRLSVGLIAYTQPPTVISPARGRPQFWQLLRLLAGLQPSNHPFAHCLAQARALVSGRDRVVVISPSLQPAWVGELRRFAPSAGSARGIEVILLDPFSFDPSTGSAASVDSFVSLLASLGIPATTLRQGDIRPTPASYGQLSRWEFQTLGTGRAFARHAPRAIQSGKSLARPTRGER